MELTRPKIESRDPIFFTGTRSRSRVSGNDRLFPCGSEFGPNLEIPAGPAIQLRPGPDNLQRGYCMQNYIKPQIRKKYRRNSDFYNSWSTSHPTWRRVRWSISTAHARISREKSFCINYDNYVYGISECSQVKRSEEQFSFLCILTKYFTMLTQWT